MYNYSFPEYDFKPRKYFTKFNIRALAFAAAIMLVGLGFFLTGINEKRKSQREITAVYTRAFSELSAYICGINASLERMLYITSPEQAAAVSSELFRQTGFAKANLGQLPIRTDDIQNMQVFLAQVGDYIFSLSQRAVRENNIDFPEEDKANIDRLLDYSGRLAEQFIIMQDTINRANKSGAVLDIIYNLSENTPQIYGLSSIEQIFADYPGLIYNGPFSGRNNDKTYKTLENAREISIVTAREKAAFFMGIPATRFKSRGSAESANISAFNLEAGNKFIQVTRNGGYILNYFTDRKISDRLIRDGDALRSAEEFLKKNIAETDFHAVDYKITGGVLAINFAAVQDNIILYPDLIRIGVALDNCEIIFYEASNYLKNHSARGFPEIIGADEAKKAVAPSFYIYNWRLALILCEYGGAEILCYEFTCADDGGRQFIIYVNAETGGQENFTG